MPRKAKRTWVTKAVAKRNKKGKKSYPDTHNFKFMNPSTGITNTGAGATASPSAFGSGVALNKVDNAGGLCTFVGACLFSTASCPQMSQMAQYYDRFRINKIKVRIIPEVNMASTVGQGVLPTMKVVYDFDDNVLTGATAPSIWARRGKIFRLDKEHSFTFVPRVNYNTNNISGNIPMLITKAPMMNCVALTSSSSNFVQLYGVKFAVKDWYCTSGSPVNQNVARFEITYFVSFKDQLNNSLGLNVADFNIPLPSQLPDQDYVDASGVIYDNPGDTDPLYVPDASGNEVPYVPPPV